MAIGPDFIENPHPTLRALRRESPVHRDADGSVYLTRHTDCLKVYQSRAMLSDKKREYGKKFGRSPLYEHHTTSLIFNDPPYHTTVRKLISGAFTPRKLAEFEPLIDEIVDRLLDRVEEMGTLDLIDDFAKVLPTEIISFMLGIHVCLGASLSRIEGRIALGKFVQRFPKLRPDGERKVLPLARFRGCSAFPIRV